MQLTRDLFPCFIYFLNVPDAVQESLFTYIILIYQDYVSAHFYGVFIIIIPLLLQLYLY